MKGKNDGAENETIRSLELHYELHNLCVAHINFVSNRHLHGVKRISQQTDTTHGKVSKPHCCPARFVLYMGERIWSSRNPIPLK